MADLVEPKVILDDSYHPQDALGASIRSTALTGAAGLFLAAVQNTVAKENVGAFGVFTRFGRTIGIFGTAWNGSIEISRDMGSDTIQLPWAEAFSLSARRRRTSDRRTIL